jgi:hypothetical protein
MIETVASRICSRSPKSFRKRPPLEISYISRVSSLVFCQASISSKLRKVPISSPCVAFSTRNAKPETRNNKLFFFDFRPGFLKGFFRFPQGFLRSPARGSYDFQAENGLPRGKGPRKISLGLQRPEEAGQLGDTDFTPRQAVGRVSVSIEGRGSILDQAVLITTLFWWSLAFVI